MIFTLLGTVVLGIAVAGVVLFLIRVLKLPLPRWLTPVAAGGSMLLFHIYIGYTWIDRTLAELPPTVHVVQELSERSPLQPWSLIWPIANRFTAVDTGASLENSAHPGLVLAEVLFVQRYYPTLRMSVLFDCNEPRMAEIGAGTQFGSNELPKDLHWIDVAADDPARRAACGT